MSTDRKRLSSAIQRIAREDPDIRDIIADFKNRGGIGSTSATVAGADDGRQICCDGSSSGDNNPGSDTRDPSEGGQDGLNPDDPANLDGMGPGSLGGVTDCTTGEPICFSGADWIPPEGWESPTEQPIDPEYEEGFYWGQGSGGSSLSALSPSALCSKISATRQRAGCGSTRHSATGANCKEINPDTGECLGFAVVFRYACNGSAICEEEPPRAEHWPEDGCINLAIKGGKFVASKYDPDVTSGNGWLKGKEEVELCDEFGNSFTVRASGSVEGGWKTISAQNPGDGYLYNAKGEQVARISGSEYSDPSM